jgi:hypothetical protein
VNTVEKKLTPRDALAAAVFALHGQRPDETLTSVSFGTFSDSVKDVGGGAYWSLSFNRAVGNTADAHRLPLDGERSLTMVIEKWHRTFVEMVHET